jgi:hypothetical protein
MRLRPYAVRRFALLLAPDLFQNGRIVPECLRALQILLRCQQELLIPTPFGDRQPDARPLFRAARLRYAGQT